MNFRLLIFILLGGLSMGCYAAPEGQGKIPEGGSAILTGSVPDTAAESTVPALDEIFPVLNDIPKNMVELQQLPANELPCEVVSQYLLQVKDTNRFLKGIEIKYRAFGRFVYNSNVYLIYDMTNGVEHEVYLSLYPKRKSYPLTLKIYEDFHGEGIDFTIDKGKVSLSTYAIGNSEYPVEQNLTYELNSDFTETVVSDWTWAIDGLKENVGPPKPPTSQIVPAYTTGPPKLTERGSETSRWISLSIPTGTQSLFCLSA